MVEMMAQKAVPGSRPRGVVALISTVVILI